MTVGYSVVVCGRRGDGGALRLRGPTYRLRTPACAARPVPPRLIGPGRAGEGSRQNWLKNVVQPDTPFAPGYPVNTGKTPIMDEK